MEAQILSGGFSEPVFQSQSMFRMLMDAMARPGTIMSADIEIGQPDMLGRAAASAALTLCDHETPVWLGPALAKSPVGAWLGFHTGAPLTTEKSEARFALLDRDVPLVSFALFSLGTQEYPDRSTTLIIEVVALGEGDPLILTGPGIAGSTTLAVTGLSNEFRRLWTDNRAVFPRGVDVILTAGPSFACLPRTTRIAP